MKNWRTLVLSGLITLVKKLVVSRPRPHPFSLSHGFYFFLCFIFEPFKEFPLSDQYISAILLLLAQFGCHIALVRLQSPFFSKFGQETTKLFYLALSCIALYCIILLCLTSDHFALSNPRQFHSSRGELWHSMGSYNKRGPLPWYFEAVACSLTVKTINF